MSEVISLLLVDDQALVRRGLRRLLEMEDRVAVMGEAADGHQALALLAAVAEPPDVALIDARMPGMGGLELISRLKTDHPGIATLLLTTFDDDELIFGSLAAGAGGFLLKDAEPEDLLHAIRSVRARTMVVDGNVAARVVARLADTPRADTPLADTALTGGVPAAVCQSPEAEPRTAPLPPVLPGSPALTDREVEVARLVATGASNREIATQLYLNEGTVKNHVSAALRKLGLRDRTQLAVAIRDAEGPT